MRTSGEAELETSERQQCGSERGRAGSGYPASGSVTATYVSHKSQDRTHNSAILAAVSPSQTSGGGKAPCLSTRRLSFQENNVTILTAWEWLAYRCLVHWTDFPATFGLSWEGKVNLQAPLRLNSHSDQMYKLVFEWLHEDIIQPSPAVLAMVQSGYVQ